MPAKEWIAWERGVATALLDARGDLLEVNPALRRTLQGEPRSLRDLIHPADWPGLETGQARVRLQPQGNSCHLTLTPLEEGWLAQFHPCLLAEAEREFHHRAKNHLAVISSLLQMQSNLMSDPTVQRAFADSQMRVHCLALLYGQVAPLDFSLHLQQMLEMLLDGRSGSTQLRTAPVFLGLDEAVPLSLIAHELVSNSLRHAWGSRLQVGLETVPTGVQLVVADDGPGLPSEVVPASARSLGLRLVRTLCRQLRAQVSWGFGPGTCCSLTFAPKENG